jgi:antitoxin (DNA-binding transcriptional repressor) of toxin-antitoxin stability system
MKLTEIGVVQAKKHFPALLEKVRLGRIVYITEHGRPVAELRPASQACGRLHFGCDRGQVITRDDFDTPIEW